MSDKNGRKIPLPASRDRHPPRSALRAHKPALKPRQRSSGAPPGFILPAQPVLATKPPVGPGWLFAVKHDGFRIVARKEGDKAWKGDDGSRRGDKAPYVPHETCARCLLVLRALGGSLVVRLARRGVLLPIRNSGALWWFCWLRRRLVRGAASTGQCGLSPAPFASRPGPAPAARVHPPLSSLSSLRRCRPATGGCTRLKHEAFPNHRP